MWDNMQLEIVEEKDNPFFNRKDVKLNIRHLGSATPSKAEVIKELAAKYNVDHSQIQINYIFSKKGIGESFCSIKILNEKPKAEIKEEKPKGEEVETQASEAT